MARPAPRRAVRRESPAPLPSFITSTPVSPGHFSRANGIARLPPTAVSAVGTITPWTQWRSSAVSKAAALRRTVPYSPARQTSE
ncbi:hypothetical protein [Kribbella capetownensis]|uniref:hypothetical protein n=1 Tax=Kribbella capetownensis TaxID=1572659 RepID=UPI0013F43E38|nr:hypothetical protein [Kribbella capetownensis]